MLARLVSIALGIWLMAAPDVLGYEDPARANDLIVGPLAASFAVVAIWDTTRALRWVNVAAGMWLLLSPWILDYQTIPRVNSLIVGALMVTSGLIRGVISHRVDGGWARLWKKEELQ